MCALSLAEFMKLEPEPVPMIVGRGVLPVRGKMIIGAPPKSNKSFVVLNLGIALAKGTQPFNAVYKNGTPVYPVSKPWRVLYIEQENGDTETQKRLRGFADAVDIPLFIKTRDTDMRLDTPEGCDVIRAEVAETHPDVVIFDPLMKFHLQDENSAQEMSYVLRKVDHIIEDFKCAVILVHHTKKPNALDPARGGDRLRGSSAIFADVDTLIELERLSTEHVKEPILQLSLEMRHGEPIPQYMFKRLASGEVIFMGEDFLFGGKEDRHGRKAFRKYSDG